MKSGCLFVIIVMILCIVIDINILLIQKYNYFAFISLIACTLSLIINIYKLINKNKMNF